MKETQEAWPSSAFGAAVLTTASLMLVYPISLVPILLLRLIPGSVWETIPFAGLVVLTGLPVVIVSGVLYRGISGHTLRSVSGLRGIRGHVWRCIGLYIVGCAALAVVIGQQSEDDFWLFGDILVWLVAVAVGGILGDASAAHRAKRE